MASRSPKDLKQMVAASHGDMDEMQANLSKLRQLSEDDKSENALLRSRIDEQSDLIMILKQRADDATIKARTLERINKELEQFRNNAVDEFSMQNKKINMIEARFSDLAQNHEEMIKIKDDYKNRNKDLVIENQRLMDDNARLFSKAIEERDSTILEMDKKITNLREQNSTLDFRNKESQQSLKLFEEKYKHETKDLQSRLSDVEERLKAASAKLLQQGDNKQQLEADYQRKLQTVTKEKDDLLELAMSRGKLIQEKQAENKKLQQKVEQMEKSVRDMHDKFEREAAAVNVNLTVRKLKAELEELEERYDESAREFEAYKKHSSALLQKEKTLNEKLRHLVG